MHAVIPTSSRRHRQFADHGAARIRGFAGVVLSAIMVTLLLSVTLCLLEDVSPFVLGHRIIGSLTRAFVIGSIGYVSFWIAACGLLDRESR